MNKKIFSYERGNLTKLIFSVKNILNLYHRKISIVFLFEIDLTFVV
jgi:hypothetical protein